MPALTPFEVLHIDEMLPLLASRYETGRLVPFIGAGMSRPKLADWGQFIDNLEKVAGPHPSSDSKPEVRAQRASEVIRNSYDESDVWRIIGEALKGEKFDMPGLPAQTKALASIFWPLTVSTNYDDLFYRACREAFNERLPPMVLGRAAADCKRIVSSLSSPFDTEIIWHIQGFLGEPDSPAYQDDPELTRLRRELVIGHSEYRKANTDLHFRRCFGEVFRSRSFLFLGSGLSEEYFWNLFGEMLEFLGPSPVPHFAFLSDNKDIDVRFLAQEMNITVCKYRCHDELIQWLKDLKSLIDRPCARISGLHVELKGGSRLEIASYAQLPMPETYSDSALAVVVRAGPEGRFDLDRDLGNQKEQLESKFYCRQFCPDAHVLTAEPGLFAVRARTKPESVGETDSVGAAMQELLALVNQWNTLHVHLPSAGGTVPPIYGFIEAVRAFGAWTRENNKPLRLVAHVGPQVLLNVNSGQINLHELLTSRLIRFWTVVNVASGDPTRRVFYRPPNFTLRELLEEVLGVSDTAAMQWSMSVCPSPKHLPEPLTCRDLDRSLSDVGFVLGSVLTLNRRTGQSAGRSAAAAD